MEQIQEEFKIYFLLSISKSIENNENMDNRIIQIYKNLFEKEIKELKPMLRIMLEIQKNLKSKEIKSYLSNYIEGEMNSNKMYVSLKLDLSNKVKL
jgi:hypothetical protein